MSEINLTGTPAILIVGLIFAIPTILIGTMVAGVARIMHRRKRLAQQSIVAEYQPPDGLSPAEIGYLFDSKFGRVELVATLIDLEQRGLLIISDDNGSRVNFRAISGAHAQLKLHESLLLGWVVDGVSLTSLWLKVTIFKHSVKSSLISEGYILESKRYFSYVLYRTLASYLAIIGVTTALFGALTRDWRVLPIMMLFAVVFFPFFGGLSLLVGTIYNRMVGQPSLWTPKLRAVWPQLEGYREYLRLVELSRLRLRVAAQDQKRKNKTLPYATALSLNVDWKQQFK